MLSQTARRVTRAFTKIVGPLAPPNKHVALLTWTSRIITKNNHSSNNSSGNNDCHNGIMEKNMEMHRRSVISGSPKVARQADRQPGAISYEGRRR